MTISDELLEYFAEQYLTMVGELEADGMVYDYTFIQFVEKQLSRGVGVANV